jgi:hypothetical protein
MAKVQWQTIFLEPIYFRLPPEIFMLLGDPERVVQRIERLVESTGGAICLRQPVKKFRRVSLRTGAD